MDPNTVAQGRQGYGEQKVSFYLTKAEGYKNQGSPVPKKTDKGTKGKAATKAKMLDKLQTKSKVQIKESENQNSKFKEHIPWRDMTRHDMT